MPREMPYSEIIENHFLGKSKIIRGNSLSELQARIAATQAQWAKEEERVRQRGAHYLARWQETLQQGANDAAQIVEGSKQHEIH